MVRKYWFSKVAKIVIKCSYTKGIQIYRIIYKSIFAKKPVNFGYYDDYLAILSFIDRDCSTVFPSCHFWQKIECYPKREAYCLLTILFEVVRYFRTMVTF